MKFLAKLSEALEAPDLPDEDEWAGQRINVMFFLNAIENEADRLHSFIDKKDINKYSVYKSVNFYLRILALYPDWNDMIKNFYGEEFSVTDGPKPGIEYVKPIRSRLNSASKRAMDELS